MVKNLSHKNSSWSNAIQLMCLLYKRNSRKEHLKKIVKARTIEMKRFSRSYTFYCFQRVIVQALIQKNVSQSYFLLWWIGFTVIFTFYFFKLHLILDDAVNFYGICLPFFPHPLSLLNYLIYKETILINFIPNRMTVRAYTR